MAEVIVTDPETAGVRVGERILRGVTDAPSYVLGLATGSSPQPVYRYLAEQVRWGRASLRGLRGFALDEYLGLPAGHPQSYQAVIDREVVQPLGLDPRFVRVPDGRDEHRSEAGARFDQDIRDAGGVDLQLLGIGRNGHIGFNEPGSSLASGTRVKTLEETTRRDNARFFGDVEAVPTHAMTQGIGTILRARRLVLLAFGEAKAAAVAAALEGPVTAAVPASAVQLHPHVTVYLDEASAAGLRFSGVRVG